MSGPETVSGGKGKSILQRLPLFHPMFGFLRRLQRFFKYSICYLSLLWLANHFSKTLDLCCAERKASDETNASLCRRGFAEAASLPPPQPHQETTHTTKYKSTNVPSGENNVLGRKTACRGWVSFMFNPSGNLERTVSTGIEESKHDLQMVLPFRILTIQVTARYVDGRFFSYTEDFSSSLLTWLEPFSTWALSRSLMEIVDCVGRVPSRAQVSDQSDWEGNKLTTPNLPLTRWEL